MIASLALLILVATPSAATVGEGEKRLEFLEDDYPAALALARKNKVPLFVDAWAPWCHTCVFMREHVLNRPELRRHHPHYIFLSIDTEKERNSAFLSKFPVDALPSLFIIDASKETVVLKWLGSLNVEQFGKLLDDGEKSVNGLATGSVAARIARADRLYGERKIAESVAAYREALQAMPREHPRRARVVESLLSAYSSVPSFSQCAEAALAEAPLLPRGASYVNAVSLGLYCQQEADPKEPKNIEAGERLFLLAQDALKVDGILADDRSGLYETLVGYLEAKGDKQGSKQSANAWLDYLEAEAFKAKTPAARAVFDPHRLNAALACGQPQRAVSALLRSEQELPDDYNPPARLALAYRELGKFDDALASVDRAMKKVYGPRKLRVMETRASILRKTGDVAGERKQLGDALEYAKSLPAGQRKAKTITRFEGLLEQLKSTGGP